MKQKTSTDSRIENISLITETKQGTLIRSKAKLEFKDGRIWFLDSPYSLKDEIKAMKGSRWHGYEEPPRKVWSVEDCQRNRIQIEYLKGENPYEWFDREIIRHEYTRPVMSHQKDLTDSGLTYHYQIWAAEMGVGKSLSAIELIEKSGVDYWWWVGPKPTLPAIRREFRKWGLSDAIRVDLLTYEGVKSKIDDLILNPGLIPQGVICDESSRLKNYASQRSVSIQKLADLIRQKYGYDGYVIEMSGTPAPKSPLDWWSQCEIAWPGFVKEGSVKALEQRLGFFVDQQFDAGMIRKRVGWRDTDNKCEHCGLLEHADCHDLEFCVDPRDYHPFKRCKNEVAAMYERLSGLVVVKTKRECLDLPEKQYQVIKLEPSKSILRVAQAIKSTTSSAMTSLTLLRELSDGFQYRNVADGEGQCTHCAGTKCVDEWADPENPDATYQSTDMLDPDLVKRLERSSVPCPNCGGTGMVTVYKRISREVATPKEPALIELLEQNEEQGRLIVFAGFTGSIDRVTNICLANKWSVIRCDSRGYHFLAPNSDSTTLSQSVSGDSALEMWADLETHENVVFVANPESGGMGLTLTEARMEVFWSNSFKAEYRSQAEDRIHRPGMDVNKGATIVDLVHLPSDERVLEVLRENRDLELMTMGELSEILTNG